MAPRQSSDLAPVSALASISVISFLLLKKCLARHAKPSSAAAAVAAPSASQLGRSPWQCAHILLCARVRVGDLSLSLSLYIYIYMCVCVYHPRYSPYYSPSPPSVLLSLHSLLTTPRLLDRLLLPLTPYYSPSLHPLTLELHREHHAVRPVVTPPPL